MSGLVARVRRAAIRVSRWLTSVCTLGEIKASFPALDALGPCVAHIRVDTQRVWELIGLNAASEPKFMLVLGPPDNILGHMDLRTGDVVIDVGEICMGTPEGISGDTGLLHKRLVTTIAHEARHRWQYETWGRSRMRLDKAGTLLGILLLAFLVWLTVDLMGLSLLRHWLSGGAYAVTHIGLVVLMVLLWRKILRRVPGLAYLVSATERDARRYAAQAADDARWGEAVEVSKQRLHPHFIRLSL